MSVTKEQVIAALSGVLDPELKRDVVTLNMVQQVTLQPGDGGVATAVVDVNLPGRAGKFRELLRSAMTQAIESLGVKADVRFTLQLSSGGKAAQTSEGGGFDASQSNNPLPGVKRVIAVGAGKGGVGKSTVSVNLAVGLARQGASVGVLDADIYGPSIPTLLGTDVFEPRAEGNMLIPFETHGVKSMTIGALVDDDKPLIWRGPMAHGAFRQLAVQTSWGELDYLIVDLPPGTGDVPLTMSQVLPITGAVVVCTPQKVAQDDARRAVAMFRQLHIEVLGLVENMSYFIGDDGKEYDLFGRGGAEMLAHQLGIPFLGAIPINMNLRRNSDAGDPTANFTNDDTLAGELDAVVRSVTHQLKVLAMSDQQEPTLTIL
jgi:ATP-binding protein involved in chromosome partitioning